MIHGDGRKTSGTLYFLHGMWGGCKAFLRSISWAEQLSVWIQKVIHHPKEKHFYPFRWSLCEVTLNLDGLQHIRGNVIIKNSFHSSWLGLDSQLSHLLKVSSIWAFGKCDSFIICFISKVRALEGLHKLSQSCRKSWIKHAYPEF